MAKSMKEAILRALDTLSKMSAEELRSQRYDKFRKMGKIIEA
jgi:acetyl-CoA carboxylase alpha subunit